jgi:protein ImuB
MSRTGSVWIPDWPVVAARRRDESLRGVPVVVRERVGARDLVRAASADARALGVMRGMRRREAEAICPEAACVDADEANEARAFEAVARAVQAFTPRVVLDRPGICEFPTRGPARYFGGDDELARRVRATVSVVLGPDGGPDGGPNGENVRVGIADGAFTARLPARRDWVIAPGESAQFLAPWPVATFGDEDLAGLLVRLGLRTLGDVAGLPPDAVLARFGIDGRHFHDLARGIDPGPPVLVPPPADMVEQTALDPPAERVDMAAFAAKELADRLLSRLAERGLACTRVLVEAETEHGEVLTRCWRHANNDGRGALTPGTLSERVRWQLDGWITTGETTAGIVMLRLAPDEVVPADGRQLGFWGGDQAAHDRADRALARVQGMLGFEAVATAVVQGGRTPAEQVRWVPWGEPRAEDRPRAASWPGALPAPYPARVFDPPIAADLIDRRGQPIVVSGRGEQMAAPASVRSKVVCGDVTGWAGPWASDVRWWDPDARNRCARYQLTVWDPNGNDVACLVVLEGGTTSIEAIYD